MNLENQVCSLESARKLKELGVKQESLFYWQTRTFARPNETPNLVYISNRSFRDTLVHDSAFTVAELGDLALKESNIVWKIFFHRVSDGSSPTGWEHMIYSSSNDLGFCAPADFPDFINHTEAEARAKCLIYIIEKGLVDVKKISI